MTSRSEQYTLKHNPISLSNFPNYTPITPPLPLPSFPLTPITTYYTYKIQSHKLIILTHTSSRFPARSQPHSWLENSNINKRQPSKRQNSLLTFKKLRKVEIKTGQKRNSQFLKSVNQNECFPIFLSAFVACQLLLQFCFPLLNRI